MFLVASILFWMNVSLVHAEDHSVSPVPLDQRLDALRLELQQENPSVRLRVYQTLLGYPYGKATEFSAKFAVEGKQKQELIEAIWQDDSLYVREQIAELWLQEQAVEALSMGWGYSLRDQERCRLALWLSDRVSIAGVSSESVMQIRAGASATNAAISWPVYSNETFEDKWVCSFAAATILPLNAPLSQLLERGDFPLSLPFVWDVYAFLNPTIQHSFIAEMEWVEEGLRAPLWTVIALKYPEHLQLYSSAVETWTIGECFDALDTVWDVYEREPQRTWREGKRVMSVLKKHSPECREWSNWVERGIRGRGLHAVLRTLQDPLADRDSVLAAFRWLQDQNLLSKREQQRVRRAIQSRMAMGMDESAWVALLQSWYLWGTAELLEQIETKIVVGQDAVLDIELQIAKYWLTQ